MNRLLKCIRKLLDVILNIVTEAFLSNIASVFESIIKATEIYRFQLKLSPLHSEEIVKPGGRYISNKYK